MKKRGATYSGGGREGKEGGKPVFNMECVAIITVMLSGIR